MDFITEGDAATAEWSVTSGACRLLVECTSYERLDEQVNNDQRINGALATAWNAKREKFPPGQAEPALISTDISGVFVSREFGTLFRSDFWSRLDAVTPLRYPRPVGCYDLAQDWELLQQESQNRQMLGVISSALYSGDAMQRNIRGLMAYQGAAGRRGPRQRTFRVPKRGFLVWRGPINDPDLRQILVALHRPATPRPVPAGVVVPLSLFLV